ncbi:MAG TPA: AbgT family transporter [Opitutaceae bacterium]
MTAATAPQRPLPFATRLLNGVERAGNALPHPVTLFIGLSALVMVLSWLLSTLGVQVAHPATGKPVFVVNLLSLDGLQRLMVGALPNFIGFAPLGTVLVSLLGLSIAEGSGLIAALLRQISAAARPRTLTILVVLAGVISHAGTDVGYVLLIPLSAGLFLAVGRHPLAGLAAAFAGVSGGFSANFLISAIDVVLAGMTQEAARLIDPAYVVTPMANYYFMAASSVIIVVAGTWVTERIIETRLGGYTGTATRDALESLSPAERRGLRAAGIATAVLTGVILLGTIPANGFLNDPAKPGFLNSYVLRGFVMVIFMYGAIPGLTYGWISGRFRNDHDVVKAMTKAIETLAGYVVLVFFIAQFVALFNWTNVGIVTAVEGAEFLRKLGLGPIPLMIAFVLLAAAIDLVLGSATAKWAVMAPIFVPMFMLLGYSPELAQSAYRIGDSVVNIITPLMSYFPLVLTFAQRYEPKAGIGTLVATMLPYSISFLVVWTLLLVLWLLAGWPLGPGAPLFVGSTSP